MEKQIKLIIKKIKLISAYHVINSNLLKITSIGELYLTRLTPPPCFSDLRKLIESRLFKIPNIVLQHFTYLVFVFLQQLINKLVSSFLMNLSIVLKDSSMVESSERSVIRDVISLNFWRCQRLPCKNFLSVTFFLVTVVHQWSFV